MNYFKQLYINNIIKLPYVKDIHKEYSNNHIVMPFPPGHFYNPVNDFEYLEKKKEQIFFKTDLLEGINLNQEKQFEFLQSLLPYYFEFPFKNEKSDLYRYYLENSFYTGGDAVFLYLLMRYLAPSNIIEVGSGYSSALMLDINQLFLNEGCKISFIEPFPERLQSLIKEDELNIQIKQNFIQEIPLEYFSRLGSNDILFIDSSHVSKTGSDVNYIIFEVLPKLKSGTYIHFHDIFHPFEYPENWILERKLSWNECYLLRAFLMYNENFEIVLFNSLLFKSYPSWIQEHLPICLNNKLTVPGSIWLRKK